jgi:hypothetical protein
MNKARSWHGLLLITYQLINGAMADGTILPTMHLGGSLLPPAAVFGLQI